MADRLKRLDVIYEHSPMYFVTACTANRRKLLATEVIHTAFKNFAVSGPTYGTWVGAYVRDNPVRAGLAERWEEWPYQGEIFNLEFHNARF